MTIAELLKWATKQLASPEDYLSIDILLAHILNKPRSFLYANAEYNLSEKKVQQFKTLLIRFLQGEPIAYLIGQREFWSLSLKVTSDTLIPRPETEMLVELALKLFPNDECIMADLGTGSGAIALALGSERPHWKIIATDKSKAALKVAEENAKSLNIQNVEFVQGDWCEALRNCHCEERLLGRSNLERSLGSPRPSASRPCDDENEEKGIYSLIISNPPYLDETELDQKLSYEPHSALVAKESGLGDIRHIVQEAWSFLKKGGYLLIEHGYTQGEKVRSIFLEVGYNDIKTEQDLAGQERITWGRRG